MAELLLPHAEARPDVEAVVDDQTARTWNELNGRVNALINAAARRGVGPGSSVAVMSTNRVELFEVFLAAMHAGWTVIPVNWHWVGREVAHVLEDGGVDAVFVEDAYVETVAAAVGGDLDTRVFARIGGAGVMPFGSEPYEDLIGDGSTDEPTSQAPGAPMFYTSGTTGYPKGVRSSGGTGTLAGVASTASKFCDLVGVDAGTRLLLCGPAYHSAQWMFSLLPVLAGARLRIQQGTSAAEILSALSADETTHLNLVPTQMVRLLELPREIRRAYDPTPLRRVWHGGAPCPTDVKRQMIDWWGPKIWEYYGGTESGFVSLIGSDDWSARPRSVGRPLPTIEVSIRDDCGAPVATGEVGQVWFRSTVGRDFIYENDHEKTLAAHAEDGFATLGDIGFVDANGWLSLTDRKIDMIVSGGVNIYPAEVEGALIAHASVADVAVIGVPDHEFGESVLALVEPVDYPPPPNLADELDAHCRLLLAGYKRPRRFVFKESIGRLATGKLNKRTLREPYWRDAGRAI